MSKSKQIISFLLSLALVLMNVPLATATVFAQDAIKTRSEAVSWLESQEGMTYDFNGKNGTQCVEFVKAYVNWLICGDPWTDCWNRATLNGNNIWQNSLWAELGWEVYYNDADFVPQPGDIFSAGLGTNGNHTGVVISSTVSGAYIADANARDREWSNGESVWLHNITWKSASSDTAYGATHFIRPNFKSEYPQDVYTDIDEGVYYLRNSYFGESLDVYRAKDAEAQNVQTHPFHGGDAQAFEVKKSTTTAGYVLRPLCSSSRILNVYADTVVSGKNVCIYHDTGDASQRWYFESMSDGYVLRTVQNTSCVLDVNGEHNVVVATLHQGPSQIWYLENAVFYDANGGTGAPSTQMKTYGEPLTLSSTIPTRDGYCFLGWSTEASATTPTYFPGEQYNTNENITLYAVWEKESSVKVLVGDVNSDGCVDSTDARMTLQYAVDKIGDDSIDITVANVDGNEAIDSTDARLILQYAVGKTKNFPVETRGVGFVCGV